MTLLFILTGWLTLSVVTSFGLGKAIRIADEKEAIK